jgi:hypothetical protein
VLYVVNGLKIWRMIEQNEIGREFLELVKIPKICIQCKSRALIRHGLYWRRLKLENREVVIPIQRVKCRKCGSSGSCLYDFLVPFKRRTAKTLIAALEGGLPTAETLAVPRSTRARTYRHLLQNATMAYFAVRQIATATPLDVLLRTPERKAPPCKTSSPIRQRCIVILDQLLNEFETKSPIETLRNFLQSAALDVLSFQLDLKNTQIGRRNNHGHSGAASSCRMKSHKPRISCQRESSKLLQTSGPDLKKCQKSEKRNGGCRSSSDQCSKIPASYRGKTAAIYLGA